MLAFGGVFEALSGDVILSGISGYCLRGFSAVDDGPCSVNALLFLAVRRCKIVLPWRLSSGCRVRFCRTIETSVLVPHLVVELLLLSGLRGALLCRWSCAVLEVARHHCRIFLFRLGMEEQLWRERCLLRLVRRSRISCCFCGGVCEAAGSIAFGFCGFVLCL